MAFKTHQYECGFCQCRVNFEPKFNAEYGVAMCFSCTEYTAGRLEDDCESDPFEDDGLMAIEGNRVQLQGSLAKRSAHIADLTDWPHGLN